jgi:hypothetical protein
MLDTVVELTTYVHHLIVQMDSNMGDWYDLRFKLFKEREWMRIQHTRSFSVRPSVKFYGASFEEFVKSNEKHMPAYSLLLRALAKIGIDTSVWVVMKHYMEHSCPGPGSGGQHNGCPIGVSSEDLPRLLKAYCKLEMIAEDRQGLLLQIVDALKDVRKKEPGLTGWAFSGYPD